jgi:hypothetical protein
MCLALVEGNSEWTGGLQQLLEGFPDMGFKPMGSAGRPVLGAGAPPSGFGWRASAGRPVLGAGAPSLLIRAEGIGRAGGAGYSSRLHVMGPAGVCMPRRGLRPSRAPAWRQSPPGQ